MIDEIDRASELSERERSDVVAQRVTNVAKSLPARTHCSIYAFPIESGRLMVLPFTQCCAECAREAAAYQRTQTGRFP